MLYVWQATNRDQVNLRPGVTQDGDVRPSSARNLRSWKPRRALATMVQALYEYA